MRILATVLLLLAMSSLGMASPAISAAEPGSAVTLTVGTEVRLGMVDLVSSADAQENQLVMNAEVLKLPILQANPLSVAAADRMCAEFLEANPATDDLVMRVRQIILERNNEFWSEDTIAERLNITSRTLRNRLRRLNTSYQAILDSLREQIARDDLTRSTLTVNAIAEHVGYSDARSFRRAFKKWTGMTPDDYRNHRSIL